MPFAWAAGAAAIGGIASSVISSNAAGKAAQEQSTAATTAANDQSQAAIQAAQIEANATDQATATELGMFNTTQGNEAPYLAAGNNALASLSAGLANGQFSAPYSGAPPTAPNFTPIAAETPFTMADYQQSPGYQFQLKQGTDAVLNNASALGGVNSGNTLKALTQYGQGLANQDFQQGQTQYNNLYNTGVNATNTNNANALNTFNAGNTSYLDAYNAYVQQQQQQFSQLQTVAGSGQNAAAGLGALGANVGSTIGANTINSGIAQGTGITNAASAGAQGIIGAANANSAGTVAGANALSTGINSATGGLSQNYLLYSILNGGAYAPYGGGGVDVTPVNPGLT